MGLVQESYRQVLSESAIKKVGIDETDGLIFEAASELYRAAVYYDKPLNEAVTLDDAQLQKLFKVAPKMKRYGKTQTTFGDDAKAAMGKAGAAASSAMGAAKTAAGAAKQAGEISAGHAKQILSAVNKWQNKLMGKAANTETGKKLNDKFDQIRTSVDQNADKIPGGKFIVDQAKKLGDLAKKNPKSAAFATAALAGAAGIVTANPVAGAAAGKLLQAALGVMKGEKATDILVKGGTAMAAGAAGGVIADIFGGSLDNVPTEELDSSGNATYKIGGEEVSEEQYERVMRKRKIPQWAEDLRAKGQLQREFAEKMGIEGNVNAKFVGGVPVEINGQAVPTELYSEDQLKNIEAAKQMQQAMSQPGGGEPADENFDDGTWG